MDKFGKCFQNLVFKIFQLSDLNKDMKVKCKIFILLFLSLFLCLIIFFRK